MQAKLFLRTTILFFALISNAYALTKADFVDKYWILKKLNGIGISHELYVGKKPMIKFSPDFRFSAWAGCNQIAGGYRFTEPTTLLFDANMVMTKMACAGPQNLEDEYVTMLQSVHMLSINGPIMQFMDTTHKVVAEYEHLPE